MFKNLWGVIPTHLRTGRVNGESTEICCLCKLVQHRVPTQDKYVDSLYVYVSQYFVI